ncbi:cyclodeaminase/cyclohydrolase family protein, partial [Acidobacteriia bacterium AH_259_A11_L15]|nr:cyclodeaminase/cyclohydrolase family protein [Acidobacteriia bacterium AH_259_A11_L15]
LAQLEPISSPAMASDLKTGAHLAVAALRGALENVKINLDSLQDKGFKEHLRERLAQLENRLSEAAAVSR